MKRKSLGLIVILSFFLISISSCILSDKLYPVHFCNTDGTTITMYAVKYGEKVVRPTKVNVKEHYVFEDWYTDITLTTKFNFENNIISETYVYAKIKPEIYTVSFNTNCDVDIESVKVEYGNKILKPDSIYISDCYTFDSWYIDKSFNKKYDFDELVSQNLTLFAKWNIHHDYDVENIKKAPTCIESGIKESTCKLCNNIYEEILPALGHTYGEWNKVTPAVCGGENGLKKRTCTTCNNIEEEIISYPTHKGTYKCSNSDCGAYLVPVGIIGEDYIDGDGLNVKINSITITEQTGYIGYTINYTVKNNQPDTAISPGTFDLIYSDNTSDMQTGIFNDLYYGDTSTRSYTFKVLRTKTPVIFKYSNIFSSNNKALYWGIPE